MSARAWRLTVDDPREGPLASAGSTEGGGRVRLSVENGELVLRAPGFTQRLQDARLCGRHQVDVLSDASGTAIHLDGYVVWSTRLSLAHLLGSKGAPGVLEADGPHVCVQDDASGDLAALAELVDREGLHAPAVALAVRDRAPVPTPLITFAAPEICATDAATLAALPAWVAHAQVRVRGPGQYGVVLAGSHEGAAVLRLRIDAHGLELTRAGEPPLRAAGYWADGRLHHVALALAGGATELWVDGWLRARASGTAPRLDRLTVGQDLTGERLMGEVSAGGVQRALSDQQIARLARRAPLTQVPVFDRHPTGAYHRIPAVLALGDGTLLALADARHGLPNDAPNRTDLVLSRSTDAGTTWSQPQVVMGFGQSQAGPVSVTDAALVEDSRGRVHVLVDLYPAGLGLLNSDPGAGVAAEADVSVDAAGEVRTGAGEVLGRLAEPTMPATRVGHIAHLTSSDGGRTWGAVRLITAQVKDPWMPFLGIAPGAGIRLRDARWPERLVVPCYFSDEAVAQFSAAALLSDDDGLTWRRSSSTNAGRVVDGVEVDERRLPGPRALMSEGAVVELPDGRVLMFTRSQCSHVLRALSRDGGETWGDVAEEAMTEIFCQPAAAAREGVVWMANAARMQPYRGCGTVYRTGEYGVRPWRSVAVNPRHHGYQSLVALPDAVGMLWERETAGVWFTVVPDEVFEADDEL